MPEQPDDPIHYEMKIPPEPKNDQPKKAEDVSPERGGDKETEVSRDDEKGKHKPGN